MLFLFFGNTVFSENRELLNCLRLLKFGLNLPELFVLYNGILIFLPVVDGALRICERECFLHFFSELAAQVSLRFDVQAVKAEISVFEWVGITHTSAMYVKCK